MAYELKKSDEQLAEEKKKQEEKEMYGDVPPEPVVDLPTYKDMGAVSSGSAGVTGSNRGIIYKIIGVLILGVVIFFVIKGIRYMLNSGGQDITEYLSASEVELQDHLNLKFEENDQRAKNVPQYSGGTVTVHSANGLDVVYIDGKQVGVATDSRDYRFYGVGINDADKDVYDLLTYPKTSSFVMLNDLMGGNSDSTFYYDKSNNTCLVITVNKKNNRVVYMAYFTDLALITKNVSGLEE